MKKVYTTICLLTIAIAASAQLTLHKPETKVATDITSSSFTANWGAVPNADGYCVFVYDRKEVSADGDVTIGSTVLISEASSNQVEAKRNTWISLRTTTLTPTDGAHTGFQTLSLVWWQD